jgi:peptide/nickel transport system ATP-binding protein
MGKMKVLNGVDFSLNEGEKVGIIGESGCGKTTTMKSVLRILATNAIVEGGEIRFRGNEMLSLDKKKLNELRRKNLTMIFQDPTAALNPVFKVSSILGDVIKSSGKIGDGKPTKELLREKSLDALKEVSLPDPERVLDSYPFQLSGGMRQRVCIAMSLATAKDLLIADEPTTNLDVTIQDQVLRLMKDLVNKKNLSIILISHALGTIRNTVDTVYVMYAGTMIEAAKTKKAFLKPHASLHSRIVEISSKVDRSWIFRGHPRKNSRLHQPADWLQVPSTMRVRPRNLQSGKTSSS